MKRNDERLRIEERSKSILDAFIDIRRYEGEDKNSLYNRMTNIYMQLPSHCRPIRPMFVAQFVKAWKPKLVYWLESSKQHAFDQVNKFIDSI